jgi:hypothetical protein
MVHPVLEVYSLDGTRLVRTGEPFIRAVNGDWAKFTGAVHAAAPQVVIEEQKDPRAPEGGYVLWPGGKLEGDGRHGAPDPAGGDGTHAFIWISD